MYFSKHLRNVLDISHFLMSRKKKGIPLHSIFYETFSRYILRYKNPKLKGYDLNLLTIKLGGRFKVPRLNIDKYQ